MMETVDRKKNNTIEVTPETDVPFVRQENSSVGLVYVRNISENLLMLMKVYLV